ncbi:TIGR02206 family membrane protein [Neobacillus niacini]|uniref:YwaF family protein n=1 Tax=Neobacillus niacini TaxID=86668 RepID=UPI0039833628
MGLFGGNNSDYIFEMFSISHFIIIAILFIGSYFIFFHRETLKDEKWRKTEVAVALSLIVIEVSYHIWLYTNEMWDVSHSIPLDLCSISLILSALLLLTRKKLIYEILLFTALLGATQAIFTPLLTFNFPHFRFFHFFYTHLMIIWVVFYYTWVKGYQPTILSVVKMFVFLNLLLPIIMFINTLVDGNYMFLSHKPSTPSLLDILGPYPWYIVSMEFLLIVLSLIVWLIFRKRTSSRR